MESQIEKIRQKYWDGSTTLEEERLLKKSMLNEPTGTIEDRFFAELEKRKAVQGKKDFAIPKRKKTLIWQISSVAATIIILIALSIGFNNTNNNNQYVINNPEEAYDISREALLLVSSKLNKGKIYTGKIDKINDIKQTINK